MRRIRANSPYSCDENAPILQIGRPRRIRAYQESVARSWFWRLSTGAELVYVEEEDGHLRGYEFKHNTKSPRAPAAWEKSHPGSSYAVVNRGTCLAFVLLWPDDFDSCITQREEVSVVEGEQSGRTRLARTGEDVTVVAAASGDLIRIEILDELPDFVAVEGDGVYPRKGLTQERGSIGGAQAMRGWQTRHDGVGLDKRWGGQHDPLGGQAPFQRLARNLVVFVPTEQGRNHDTGAACAARFRRE